MRKMKVRTRRSKSHHFAARWYVVITVCLRGKKKVIRKNHKCRSILWKSRCVRQALCVNAWFAQNNKWDETCFFRQILPNIHVGFETRFKEVRKGFKNLIATDVYLLGLVEAVLFFAQSSVERTYIFVIVEIISATKRHFWMRTAFRLLQKTACSFSTFAKAGSRCASSLAPRFRLSLSHTWIKRERWSTSWWTSPTCSKTWNGSWLLFCPSLPLDCVLCCINL